VRNTVYNTAKIAMLYNSICNNNLKIMAIKETFNAGVDIQHDALQILECLGFDIDKKGTKFLAELVDNVYHERYGSYNDDFYNFDITSNPHFIDIAEHHGYDVKTVRRLINSSIRDISVSNGSYTSLVLNIAENLINVYSQNKNIIAGRKVYQR